MDRIILVDSSVWVDYFRRGDSRQAKALDEFLSLGVVATCDPVRAEVISGVQTKTEFERLRELFGAVDLLQAPDDVWLRIAEYRFLLARKGVQASLIDLWVAVVAMEHHALIWTFDKDFLSIRRVLSLEMFDLNE